MDTSNYEISQSNFAESLVSSFFTAENKAVGIMKPGHCFTIEPMISEGKHNVLFAVVLLDRVFICVYIVTRCRRQTGQTSKRSKWRLFQAPGGTKRGRTTGRR